MKILIIEDEYSLADAIAETLKNDKFNVSIETNGEDGADDYITKPFAMRELMARIKAVRGARI